MLISTSMDRPTVLCRGSTTASLYSEVFRQVADRAVDKSQSDGEVHFLADPKAHDLLIVAGGGEARLEIGRPQNPAQGEHKAFQLRIWEVAASKRSIIGQWLCFTSCEDLPQVRATVVDRRFDSKKAGISTKGPLQISPRCLTDEFRHAEARNGRYSPANYETRCHRNFAAAEMRRTLPTDEQCLSTL